MPASIGAVPSQRSHIDPDPTVTGRFAVRKRTAPWAAMPIHAHWTRPGDETRIAIFGYAPGGRRTAHPTHDRRRRRAPPRIPPRDGQDPSRSNI
jgi:hypothetical protein